MITQQLKRQVNQYQKLKYQIDKLQAERDKIKEELLKVLETGQHVIGRFRVTKSWNDSCAVASFERSAHFTLTVSKI